MSLVIQTEGSSRVVESLATNAATQLASLNCRVEELSGQLTGVSQKNLQQLELLEKIWEKANLLQPLSPAPAAPRQPPR